MSFSINRVGQKVVCVASASLWQFVCSRYYIIGGFPEFGRTYTVTAFENIVPSGRPGVHLAEMPGLTCECKSIRNSSWPIAAFRPVDERETDISALQALLDTAPAEAPEVVEA